MRRQSVYEDFLKVPPEKVAEIIDGELVVSPRPAPPHAGAAFGIAAALVPFDQQNRRGPEDPGGWRIYPEPELRFPRAEIAEIVVPDLAGWRVERLPTLPSVAYFDVRPDWICEVLSPATERTDRRTKMRIYAAEGVPHVWLVNPLTQVLEVYRLERGERYLALPAALDDRKVRAEPFQQVEIDLTRWWPPTG